MSRADGSDVVQLLLEMEVLDKEDVLDVKAKQSDVLLRILLNKRVVQPAESDNVRSALEELATSANQTRRTQAQTRLYHLITKGLDQRIDHACGQLKRHKERITSRSWPAVPVVAKGEG